MEETEELEELLEKEDIEVDKNNPQDIKRKVQVVENELDNISDIQWNYVKQLLKFGLAAWIFGFSAFATSLIVYKGPALIVDTPPLSLSLLIVAGSAPVIITIFLIQKHRKSMDRMERIRKGLLSQYESTILKKVEENITE